jgi:hypothetical protein
MAGIQSVVILGHYCLETERGRTGDAAWPLWGIASRLLIAVSASLLGLLGSAQASDILQMGLHRDGERWNLPPSIVQERR